MANPSTIDNKPAVLVAGTTTVTIPINANRSYALIHAALNEAGAADTNTIAFSTDGQAVQTTAASRDNKFRLPSAASRTIGPGVPHLKFATAAGAPTFTVIPGRLTPREA